MWWDELKWVRIVCKWGHSWWAPGVGNRKYLEGMNDWLAFLLLREVWAEFIANEVFHWVYNVII